MANAHMSMKPDKTIMSHTAQRFSRRAFCIGAASALALNRLPGNGAGSGDGWSLVAWVDRLRILHAAGSFLKRRPRTITSVPAPRSPGTSHDFYSEADYFWPDPADLNGPYISRDGKSNPAIFKGHRRAMIALSIQMPALTAAWRLTGDRAYARHAADHLRSWFIDPETRMTPSLEYAQAVRGASTGSPFGIIDTIHLVEVARAAAFIAPVALATRERSALYAWFHDYLHWMITSTKGEMERDSSNNHAVCWALQASEFARLTGDVSTRADIGERFKRILLPNQMAPNGSFPEELRRTKPYSYSVFNFDMIATLGESRLNDEADLFVFSLPDGRSISRAADFIFPFIEDKNRWPYSKDVEHFDSLPVRSPGLLFCGLAYGRKQLIDLWQKLNPDPIDEEIIRNFPVRQPLLWL